jgi:hypothetical protein
VVVSSYDPDEEVRAFTAAFRAFLEWVTTAGGDGAEANEVVRLVGDFLGDRAGAHSVLTRALPAFEQVNLQTALGAWMAEPGRSVATYGVSIPPHHGSVSLQQIVSGQAISFISLSPPELIDLPNGPGSTLACLIRALLLVRDGTGEYVLMVRAPDEHGGGLEVEIAGLAVPDAQAVLARLDALRHQLNVYRHHVLDVSLDPRGEMRLSFGAVPDTVRDDVILPEAVLGRIEGHALGIGRHREALLAAGQHLKRGLLLYGPPGTGKTHTTRYLVGAMSDSTRLILTGRALRAIGSAAELARELSPAVLVLEDVDLVAEDRTFGPGGNPVLFDLLDAMDGAAADADLLFLLTTNRADLLEPALAARPGRVDVAVEIDLPDAAARRRLLRLYARSLTLALSEEETDAVVARTEGVTASFLKELLRRAVLEALTADAALAAPITAAQVNRALDELLDSGQRVTRSLLGVGNDPESLPPGGGAGALPAGGRGWWSVRPGIQHRPLGR